MKHLFVLISIEMAVKEPLVLEFDIEVCYILLILYLTYLIRVEVQINVELGHFFHLSKCVGEKKGLVIGTFFQLCV